VVKKEREYGEGQVLVNNSSSGSTSTRDGSSRVVEAERVGFWIQERFNRQRGSFYACCSGCYLEVATKGKVDSQATGTCEDGKRGWRVMPTNCATQYVQDLSHPFGTDSAGGE
jgi:hypothetical protein